MAKTKPVKTYKEYLAASKPITRDPAPAGALPKLTGGDTRRYRESLKYMKEKKLIYKQDLPIRKDGTVIVKQYKQLRGDV